MAGKVIEMENLQGLLPQEIPLLQKQYGKNRLHPGASHRLLRILIDIFQGAHVHSFSDSLLSLFYPW